MLDTGSPRVQLRAGYAAEQGIAVRQIRRDSWAEGNEPLRVGLLPDLRIGSAQVTEATAYFVDWGDSPFRACTGDTNRQFDGILGGNILRTLQAQIDYARDCLRLGHPEVASSATSVPLANGALPGRLYVDALFNDTVLCLMVDTGAQVTLLDQALMRRYGIDASARGAATWVSGAQREDRVGVLHELRFGAQVFQEVAVSFTDLTSWVSEEEKFTRRPLPARTAPCRRSEPELSYANTAFSCAAG